MLHEAIRLLRIYHDISATKLAEKLEISQAYLSELEKGKKSMTNRILEAYSEIFEIEASCIMRFAEQLEKDEGGVKLELAKKVLKAIKSF
jgi:transcriptional regulator with XRE-family HTH domain